MNTHQIIEYTKKKFEVEFPIPKIDYDIWQTIYRRWESSIDDELLNEYLPLREPVIKLVYKGLYGEMPFDKEYVLKYYERSFEGLEYLFYPSSDCKKIFVFFSGYSNRKTYNRYSWYWDPEEKWTQDTTYVFIRDPNNLWYSDPDLVTKLTRLLALVVDDENLSFKDCMFVGGSMGAYGALRYGISLGADKVVAIHPQLSLLPTKFHDDETWFNNISSVGNSFVDISKIVKGNLPKIFLEFGEYKADKVAANELINAYDAEQGTLVISKHNSSGHVTNSPSKLLLDSIFNFFDFI